jgi:hypothetical protein
MDRDFDGRVWAENHYRLGQAIATAFHKLAYVFQRLTARQYDAPWDCAKRRAADGTIHLR